MNEIPQTFNGKVLVHTWIYRDPDGNALGIVGRYGDGKTRKDVVPHFKRNGSGWLAGGPEEPSPLYGLDVLAKHPDEPVLIAEGERCAAALHSLGLVAVSSPGGSNAGHKADWVPLTGRNKVYLLPDHDTPGIAYMQAVAGALVDLEEPPELLLVDLPDLPDKGDVVDYLQARCPGWDGFEPVPDAELSRLVDELRDVARKARPVPADWLPKDEEQPPPLVPLETFTLPPFDTALLPGVLGQYATAVARFTETPPELPAAMVLSAVAAAVQKRFRIMVKPGYFEPLNLWLLAALPPGNRKSSVVDFAIAPLLDFERAESERLAPDIRKAEQERKVAEQQAESLRKAAAKSKTGDDKAKHMTALDEVLEAMPEVPRVQQLITTDATPERLGMLLADNNERMAWLSSEGGVFDLLAGRYSGGIPNLDLMLKAHSGDFERVDRGGRPTVYLRHPALTVGLSPQPEVLRGLVQKPGFRGRGLLGRFLYLLPDSPLGYRQLDGPPIPEPLAGEYEALLLAILQHDDETPRVLKLSDSAYADWRAFALYIEAGMRPGGEFEFITDWSGKLAGAAARLAGVFHVAIHAHGRPEDAPVSAETMAAALELAAILSRHALAAFDMMGADSTIDDARKVWRWIEQNRAESFSARECWRGVRGRFARMGEVNEALAVLAERGYLEAQHQPRVGPGRKPSPVYSVRAEIAAGWA